MIVAYRWSCKYATMEHKIWQHLLLVFQGLDSKYSDKQIPNMIAQKQYTFWYEFSWRPFDDGCEAEFCILVWSLFTEPRPLAELEFPLPRVCFLLFTSDPLLTSTFSTTFCLASATTLKFYIRMKTVNILKFNFKIKEYLLRSNDGGK